MLRIRKAGERGHFDHGWLNTFHTFSFSDYYDPAHSGFRSLRVINEDTVQPGMGFGMHPHHDMEILTYVLEGALEHRDSMGNGGTIRPGEVQRMSAGKGVRHSEFNPLEKDPVHLLQIWIVPEVRGVPPEYEQRTFELNANGKLPLIAAGDPRLGAMVIHQDAKLFAGRLNGGAKLHHKLDEARHAWLQVARGELELNGARLHAGDGAALTSEKSLEIAAGAKGAEILLFDLA